MSEGGAGEEHFDPVEAAIVHGHFVLDRYTNGERDIVIEPRALASLILAAERSRADSRWNCPKCGGELDSEGWCAGYCLADAAALNDEHATRPVPETILDYQTLSAARTKYLRLGREIEAMSPSLAKSNALHSHSKLGIFLTEVLGEDWQWPAFRFREDAIGG